MTSRGERHVEFGIALASGKKCVVIGPAENVFYCLEGVERFDTWNEALRFLIAMPKSWSVAGNEKAMTPLSEAERVLVEVRSALDQALGDTDPFCEDWSEEEIRRDEPVFWAHRHISRYFIERRWGKI